MKEHISPGIKARTNSKVRSTDCHARNMSVIRQKTNLKRWKCSLSYEYRWMAETVFSSIKRMFGEHVTAQLTSDTNRNLKGNIKGARRFTFPLYSISSVERNTRQSKSAL